jgi:hypothetical protein
VSDDRPSVWLRDVEVDGRITDVVTDGDLITSVGSDPPTSGAVIVVDGQGGALLPGLHDHHVHLLALAAALDSVAVGPADVSIRVTPAPPATPGCEPSATTNGSRVSSTGGPSIGSSAIVRSGCSTARGRRG